MRITSVYPFVLPDVLGCPRPLVRQAIVMAARELCQETMVWTELHEDVQLVNGQADYDIDHPPQSEAYSVVDVWCNGRRLQPARLDDIARLTPNWQVAASNEPTHYNMALERGVMRVFPTPAGVTGQKLAVRAYYIPDLESTSLPDVLKRCIEVLASGAKARLMVMPDKKWTSPDLAQYHRSKFLVGMDDIRIEEEHGRVPGSISVKPRQLGF